MSRIGFFNLTSLRKALLPKAIAYSALLLPLSSFQAETRIEEPTVKALFIYNFTKYVEWPVNKNPDHFVIGCYGASDVIKELNQICANKKVKGRDIEVRVLNKITEAEKCDILFMAKSQSASLRKITELIAGKEVLVVTEEKGMAMKGASINIIVKEEKYRFELNEAALKNAGLKASNQLLSLAILIK